MRKRGSSTVAAGTALALLALAGCAYQDGVHSPITGRCLGDAKERVLEADWSTARVVPLRIRQGEFSPILLNFRVDRPYVLRITNADDKSRVFRASEFFENVALARIDVAGDGGGSACVAAVVIGPGQTAEVQFVTVRDGRYLFADNRVLTELFDLGHAAGIILVE